MRKLFWLLWITTTAFSYGSFQSNHHLAFFFSSACPYCHEFSPTLKSFAKDRDYVVDAYSLDGEGLDEFKRFMRPSAQLLAAAFQEEPIRYPALFIMNTNTKSLYPVAMGKLSAAELEARIEDMIPKIIAFEEDRS